MTQTTPRKNKAKINWKRAEFCSTLSSAVYFHGEALERKLKEHRPTQYGILEFDNDGAEGCAFRYDRETVYVAFRGTEPTELSDILADIKAWPTESDTEGSVHAGFKGHLDKIYEDVHKYVYGRAVSKKRDTLVITGHSLGAAMATIFASRIRQSGYKVELYTYGSPRVGTTSWADQFKDIPSFRFVNNNDIVCQVPPFGLYHHVGQLHYMDYAGKILTDSTYWQRTWDKLRSTARAWSKLQLFDSLYDHEIPKYREKIKNK